MQTLSKSKIIAFRQCAKRLWLETNRPELKADSITTQKIQNQGNVVGEIAQRLLDPKNEGVVINPQRDGWQRSFETTQSLLARRKPIFEAAFRSDHALSLADALVPDDSEGSDAWKMIEVKSSTGLKDYHLDDVSIQSWIARRAGLNLSSVFIAHIDSSWTYPGNGDYAGLFRHVAVNEEVRERSEFVPMWLSGAQTVLGQSTPPAKDIGSHCKSPFECGFITHCSGSSLKAEKPIGWLPRIQTKGLKEFVQFNPTASIADAPDDLLNPMQARVKKHTLNGTVFHNDVAARRALQELKALQGRQFFLDFETVQFAVPIWAGTKPYQQLTFQFSCHIVDSDLSLSHKEFLDLSGHDPTRAFAESLVEGCKGSEPIHAYNASFEKGRISELANRFSDLAPQLNKVASRIIDLLPIVRSHYYHPMQQGSWSIKAVLPAIAPDLSYQQLQGVQQGGDAVSAYLEAIDLSATSDRKLEIRAQLLAYCMLDTLAMVRIWKFLARPEATENSEIGEQVWKSAPR